MVGGTTSGYSLIGKRRMASKPTMKMMLESTPAKIGRRMKKLEKFIFPFLFRASPALRDRLLPGGLSLRQPGVVGAWRGGDGFLGRDRHAGTHSGQTVDHDQFAVFQAGADD